jgi:hypothetical protein
MKQDLADAQENLAAATQLSGGTFAPLFVDITQCQMLHPAARHYYATQPLDAHFAAFALLLTANPLGIRMGNVYMKVARHSVPMRLFSRESEAVAWLLRVR